uniref:Carboxypeptidase n=1 Tax=Graphocephala atropunctata TaxID=36148 RepID=A0A1B6M480_9HEMI
MNFYWKLCILSYTLFSSSATGFFVQKEIRVFPVPRDVDLGEPLFLTPHLEKGNYEEAQKLSLVTPEIGNVTSYSGLLTVNKACDSNLFFWFFPAQKQNWKEKPLILWLQGGPGAPSLYGLFEELGPFESFETGLKKRKYSWNNEINLLIIDQPVGTGYSFTGEGCYHTNGTEVSEDLYQAVVQFHELFPNFKDNKFFISGESYAGHYIPALGHTIHKRNPSAKVKINLAAMMIGNGWSDAEKQSDYGTILYNIGLIDDNTREIYNIQHKMFLQSVAKGHWYAAFRTWATMTGILHILHIGKEVSIYNYLPASDKETPNWDKFVQSAETRRALHVGDLEFQRNTIVYMKLLPDFIVSVKPLVEELLDFYPMIYYNGQLDIICNYPMTINFLRSLNWKGEHRYRKVSRTKWCVGEDLAGYYKGVHNLYDVLVRNAGHMVPADQPLWAYTLVNSVTSGTPDNPLHALGACT